MSRTLKTLSSERRHQEEIREMSKFELIAKEPLIMYVDAWMNLVKKNEVKDSTYDRLVTSRNMLEGFSIANINIEDITAKDFQMYVQQLIDEGISMSTIKKQMRIVSSPMQFAFEQRTIQFNPCISVKTPSASKIKKVTKEIEAYSEEEQKLLKDILCKHDHISYCIVEFMIETGMRVGECMALKWEDINVAKRRIKVHATLVRLGNANRSYVQEGAKSKSSNRIVPMSTRAIEIVNYLKDNYDSSFVFSDKCNEPLSYESVRFHISKVCKLAGVEYKGIHVFRHTFATNQYYKGTDVKVLSKILGHADTSITYNTYIHLYGDGFEDMLNAVS